MKRKLVYGLILIAMMACKSSAPQQNVQKSDNSDLGQLAPPADTSNEELEELYCLDLSDPSDIKDSALYNQTTLVDYQLREGCLCVTYQYSGCNEGTPELIVWEENTSEPTFPKVRTSLWVKGAGLCEQLLTAKACFSMKRMQLVGNDVLVSINREDNNVMVKTQN
ncbi:MAG: hypothetical protein ACPF9D_10475 [Owenweeksia sp.]